MDNNLKYIEYKTQNGVFFCSDEVDKKMVNHFKIYDGHSLDEIENLKKFITADSIVFDVGAHIGTFSIPLSTVCKKVYSFEPNPTNIFLFEKNVIANNRTNIELIKKPVADKVMEVSFVAQPVSGQSYATENSQNSAGRIGTVTLDSLSVTPDLIKIDIEGFEVKALLGAKNILSVKPVLYIEYALWCLTRAGSSTEELDAILRKNKYKTYLHIKDNYFVKLSNLSYIIGKDQTSNLLCISVDTELPKGLETISFASYVLSKIKPYERIGRLFR